MNRCVVLSILLACACAAFAQEQEPFDVQAELQVQDGKGTVVISIAMEPQHFLYADMLEVSALKGGTLNPVDIPTPRTLEDPFGGGTKLVYDEPVELVYRLENPNDSQVDIKVTYQGCSHETCFFPEEIVFTLPFPESLQTAHSQPEQFIEEMTQDPAAGEGDWQALAARFRQTGRTSGYKNSATMLEFIHQVEAVDEPGVTSPSQESRFEKTGLLTAVLLILLGGLALNFTPCVLPMIPINLAIIGAGAQAGSRQRGFILGLAYGAAIALVYGVLGLVVVLTGATFGTLNASPWFNLVIAVIFIVLALAMFDILHIDFTRFQTRMETAGGQQKQGHIWLAFSMGGVAALLAGACVAPVVISVLVWANNLYSRGVTLGLLLPFILGLGMALPWPFAGAGMQFLPKPGRWMSWVRTGFGLLILLLATYYAHLAWRQFRQTGLSQLESNNESDSQAVGANQALIDGFNAALETHQPVILDFSASWCKNCTAMEKGTFKDEEVVRALEPYIFIKYIAEDPNDPLTREVLDYYSILGLPTIVALEPQ